jgi:hypothetical protein
MKVTELEKKILENIARNYMSSANGGMPEKAADTSCWVDCICDQGIHQIEPRQIPGVVSSLVKKGLVRTDGTVCGLTEVGLDTYKSFAGK